MRGYPKNLNSKQDYQYVLENFDKQQWKPSFQSLLDNRFCWYFERYLKDDETIEQTENIQINQPQKDDVDQKRSLYIKRENPNAKIFQLGFTVDEVQQILNS